MIGEENFVSISEVRDKTTTVFKTLPKFGKRFVMSKNKPLGVIISLEEYNNISRIPLAEPDDWEKTAIQADIESENDDPGVEAFEFLKKLQNNEI